MHRISLLVLALLSISAFSASSSQRPQLTSDNSVTLMSPSGSTPLVEGFGFHGNIINIYGYGISYQF